MKWGWRIGKLAGIDVYVHATFLLLPLFIGMLVWGQTQSPWRVAVAIAFILALFGCVVLHELGHALTARRYGIRTRDITLLPIGGVARLERMPDDPVQELWVALAGPAVNVVIAAALAVLLVIFGVPLTLGWPTLGEGSFLVNLLIVNLFLVVFNMLPAFPMDGGRVLRALLAQRLNYVLATQIAASVGQGMALLFFLLGLMGGGPFLMLIALFVFLGAGEEARSVETRTLFRGIPVQHAMLRTFVGLPRDGSLRDAIQALLNGSQQDFPVLEGDRIVGMLYRGDLLQALRELGEETPLEKVMQAEVAPLEVGDMLDCAIQRMQEEKRTSLPVLAYGQVVGLLTHENIGEFIAIQSARTGGRKVLH